MIEATLDLLLVTTIIVGGLFCALLLHIGGTSPNRRAGYSIAVAGVVVGWATLTLGLTGFVLLRFH